MTPNLMMWEAAYWPRWWVICAGEHCNWCEIMPRNATEKAAEKRLADHCGRKGHESGHIIRVGIIERGNSDTEK